MHSQTLIIYCWIQVMNELWQCFTDASLQKLINSKGCEQTDNRLDDDPHVLADSYNTGGAAQVHEIMSTTVP